MSSTLHYNHGSKIEKVPRSIQGEKSSKDTAIWGNFVSSMNVECVQKYVL